MAAQIITDCGNLTLDFKQHGFCASPVFLQTRTLISKLNAKFTFHLKRGLWTTERGDSWCTDSSFSSLLVKHSQVFESAVWNPWYLCTFSYPISSFQSTLHLICFDKALIEQPLLSVMTLCDLQSLWRVSTIQLGSSTITPSTSVRNLGVFFDDQLTFKEHIAKTCSILQVCTILHNIRKMRPFLTEHAAQLLVQALVISRVDYGNALLAGLPSNTIKPLQMTQSAAARLVFYEPKRAHVTPHFVSLYWLPVEASSSQLVQDSDACI